MARVDNPYYNSTWADAGSEIAKLLGGDPEMAGKLRYQTATTELTEAKRQRQQIENDALMTGLEEALGGMGMSPADYNKNVPSLYASMARAGVDPSKYQGPIFAARGMVNSPQQYRYGAMLTNGDDPMAPVRGGRGGAGRHYAPIKITSKDRNALDVMASELLASELEQAPKDGFNLSSVIPPDALFRARQMGENTYQDTRSQTDAAMAMVEALGLPDDAKYGEIDSTPGTNWNPLNWGGGKPAILNSAGAQADFSFNQPQTPTAPAPPNVEFQQLQQQLRQGQGSPVMVSSPQEAMRLPPGTTFITPDGRKKVRP